MSFTRRQTICFLGSVAAFTSLGIDMTLPGIPQMESGLGIHIGQGTLSISMFVTGFALTPLIGGPLSDCFGRSRILLFALGGFALTAMACASATSFDCLLLYRIFQGCASGIATTLPLAVISDLWSERDARLAMSEVNTLSGLMPVIAPTLGAWTVHIAGWRLLFAVQGALAAVVTIAAARFPETLSATLRQPLDMRMQLRNAWTVLSEPALRLCALVFGLLFAATFSFTAVSPLILVQRYGMHRSTYAAILVIDACASILGAATSSLLSKHQISGHRIILAGLAMASCSTLVAVLLLWTGLPATLSLLPSEFVALFGFNLAGPSLLVDALQPVPHLLGSGSGMIRCIFMLMNSAASAILGIICSRHLAYAGRATGSTMAILTLAAVLLYTTFTRRRCGHTWHSGGDERVFEGVCAADSSAENLR